jgi:hypothetical protein
VIVLLTSLTDVLPAPRAGSFADNGHAAGGSCLLQMNPLWWEGSYDELMRALSELRSHDLAQYRAVKGRYVQAERRVMTLPVRRGRWRSRVLLPPQSELVSGLAGTTGKTARVLCRVWRSDVDEEAALAGVAWLAENMHGGRFDRINVPLELVAA